MKTRQKVLADCWQTVNWQMTNSWLTDDQQYILGTVLHFYQFTVELQVHAPSFEFRKGAQVSSVERWLAFSFRQVDSNKKWRMEDWTNYCISYLDQIVHKGSLVNFAGFCK